MSLRLTDNNNNAAYVDGDDRDDDDDDDSDVKILCFYLLWTAKWRMKNSSRSMGIAILSSTLNVYLWSI